MVSEIALKNEQKIGWISYLNLHPLRCELKKKYPQTFLPKFGHPVEINKLLVSRNIYLAPCSSICLYRDPTLAIAAPVGVVSKGPVDSVYLGVKNKALFENIDLKSTTKELAPFIKTMISEEQDPKKIARFICGDWRQDLKRRQTVAPYIKVSKHSETSVMLARIFYSVQFGTSAKEFDELTKKAVSTFPEHPKKDESRPTLELVIGDDALRRKSEFDEIIDLGQFWHTLTGLPFVFAVWQKSVLELPAKLQNICENLPEIAARCEKKMRVDPSVYFEKSYSPLDDDSLHIDPVLYWQKLYYTIDSQAMLGLVLFLTMARELCSVAVDENLSLQLLKLNNGRRPSMPSHM